MSDNESKLRIGYMNGDEMVYPFEKPEDRPDPSPAPPKKMQQRPPFQSKVNPTIQTFQTPESKIQERELKNVWMSVYAAVITYSRSRASAKEHADLAVLDYKERFNG